ncbi:MAG: DUF1294 domain-containing protein [Spartobacteria bacterium]|nr:DUF1294 domain-containing protein [Spartobacteria bacterium]
MDGVIVKFNGGRGFGFIRSTALKDDLFVHISAVKNRERLRVGQRVQFDVVTTERGLAASNVVPGSKQKKPSYIYGMTALICVAALTAGLIFSGLGRILSYLIAINVMTLVFYGYDKLIAGKKVVRIPEWILHGMAFAGGSPAAFAGQKIFRHKTIKRSFQIVYWLIVMVQAGLLVYLYGWKG